MMVKLLECSRNMALYAGSAIAPVFKVVADTFPAPWVRAGLAAAVALDAYIASGVTALA
jgi:hypothetical protein